MDNASIAAHRCTPSTVKSTTTGLFVLLLSLLACGAFTQTSKAQVEGISYTVSPVGERVFWADEAALDDAYLYGGELGLGFGQYLQVSGLYLLSRNVETNFSNLPELGLTTDQELDLQRYGGKLRINLSSQELVPFVSAGAGILRFEPDNLEAYESIYATLGAGVTFSLADRYTLSVGGELLSYRYDPAALFFEDGTAPEGIETETVYNPAVTASLELYLGGRSPQERTAVDEAILDQFGGGLSGVRLYVEPFYGRINFNDALGFPKDQNLFGVNAGVRFGPYIGVQGFYWRGTPGTDYFDEFDLEFEDIQFYGGELKLLFASQVSQTLTPYATIGGGYMDVLSGYDEEIPEGTVPPEDRYFASGGAGVSLPLSNSLYVKGDARYLLMSTEDTDEVSEPGEVFGSLMYSLGLQFSLGGGGEPTPGEVLERERARQREEARAEREQLLAEQREAREQIQAEEQAREERLAAQIDSLQQTLRQERAEMSARLDSLAALPRTQQREALIEQRQAIDSVRVDDAVRARAEDEQGDMQVQDAQARRARMQADSMRGERDGGERQALDRRARSQRGEQVSNLSNRSITLPIPEVGEVYIRVGDTPDDMSVSTNQGAQGAVTVPMIVPTQPGQAGLQPQQGTQQQGTVQGEGITAEQVQQIVRQALREQMQQVRADSARQQLTTQEIQNTVRETMRQVIREDGNIDASALQQGEIDRLEQQIDELEDRLNRQAVDVSRARAEAEARDRAPRTTIIDRDGGEDQPFYRSFLGQPLYAFQPYTGLRAGEGPTQFQLGIRGDYRSTPTSPLRFLPEFTVGIGGGTTSFAILANGALGFAEDYATEQLGRVVQPYAGIGFGLASDRALSFEFAGNIFLGTEVETGGGRLFAEYSTLNLFDFNRFFVGYRIAL